MAYEIPFEGLWIEGKRVPGVLGIRETLINPATGEPIAYVAQGTAGDIHAAVEAAHSCYTSGIWRKASTGERARVLRRLAALIRDHRAELSVLETRNTGKPIRDSRDEVDAAADFFEYYAGLIGNFGGHTVPVSANGTGLTFREPIGVCGLVVPWNFPIVIASWKVAPALAMGNAVVLKPAPLTPLTALRLAELAVEAGLPEGVFHVVPGGDQAGAALVKHPLIRKVSFTGSTEVGAEVMRAAADGIKRISLELGGKSASIIFADADIARAASQIFSVFANAGQDCCARSRMLIERSVYAEFVDRFVEHTRQVRLGDPMDETTEVGSLISPEQRERVAHYVSIGESEGATCLIGGKAPSGPEFERGSYYELTVLTNAAPNSRVVQEEIFGPVVTMLPFDTEDEAVQLANSTPYGLSGSLWTRDIARAMRVVRAVETGVISVNTSSSVHKEMPFGGVKQSGIGRELGPDVLHEYSELKSVFISSV